MCRFVLTANIQKPNRKYLSHISQLPNRLPFSSHQTGLQQIEYRFVIGPNVMACIQLTFTVHLTSTGAEQSCRLARMHRRLQVKPSLAKQGLNRLHHYNPTFYLLILLFGTADHVLDINSEEYLKTYIQRVEFPKCTSYYGLLVTFRILCLLSYRIQYNDSLNQDISWQQVIVSSSRLSPNRKEIKYAMRRG